MADLYRSLFWPLLRQFDAETAHDQTLHALALAQANPAGRIVLQLLRGRLPSRPVSAFGLTFANPLGMAAGFDKDVRVVRGLGELGFGHVEVGTLTPRAQAGNPRPRVFRLPDDGALVNRMGFPNGGVEAALPRLRRFWQLAERPVIGVSLGKQKETPLDDAADDYLAVMRAVYPWADYLAVNISSPNTPDLRRLQGADYLTALLAQLKEAAQALAAQHTVAPRPLLVKIAPDLDWDEIDTIAGVAADRGLAGIIATNTTLSRAGVTSAAAGEAGGLSGAPLAARSRAIVRHLAQRTALPIIGVGGIASAADARALLDAGALLVQVYTGLVYAGPTLAGAIVRGL